MKDAESLKRLGFKIDCKTARLYIEKKADEDCYMWLQKFQEMTRNVQVDILDLPHIGTLRSGDTRAWLFTPSKVRQILKLKLSRMVLALQKTSSETLKMTTESGRPWEDVLAKRIFDVIKTYSEEERDQPLPRPLVTLTSEGLVIKLPKELVEGSNEKNVEAMAQQKPMRIWQEIDGTTFVAQVTIPFTQVRKFLVDGLILKGDMFVLSNFIDEMIREHQEGSSSLTEDQIEQLRSGERALPSEKEPARTPPSTQAGSSIAKAPPPPAAGSFTVEQANELVRTLTPETARQLVGEMTEEQKAGLFTAFLQVREEGGSEDSSMRALYNYLETGAVGERASLLPIDMKKVREGFSVVVQKYVLHPEVNVPTVVGDDATQMEMFLAYIVIARKLVMAKSFIGTKSKFLNALVGPVLHQVTNTDLFREAALRSPEATPGEHLERWKDAATHDIDAKPKEIPVLFAPRETPPELENVEVRPVRVAGKDTVVSLAHALGDRPTQEDTHAVGSFTVKGQPVGYYGIFDGHAGSATSHFLQEEIQKIMEEEFALLGKPLEDATNAEIENILSVVTVKAHVKWLERRVLSDSSGATFSMALVIKNKEGNAVWAVNAGDSRILALRDEGAETSTVQLTEDASPTKRRFKKGVTLRGGEVGGDRVVGSLGSLAVARAIGDVGGPRA